MTTPAAIKELAAKLEQVSPGCVTESTDKDITVRAASLAAVMSYLKTSPEQGFNYLNYLTAVDYKDHFLMIYNLISLRTNVGLVLKARCESREKPTMPSVAGLWKGAVLQEREVFDLMGITFENHPDMKRIFLWDGFEGYPLRKDFVI